MQQDQHIINMVSMEVLEKLLGEMHKDYSQLLEMSNKTHDDNKIEILNRKIERLEYQNTLNLETLEEHVSKEETEEHGEDTEIVARRKVIDQL